MACPPWSIPQRTQQTTSWIGSCACTCSAEPNLAQLLMTEAGMRGLDIHPGGPVTKETNDESSSAIGYEGWMKSRSSMSCEHLADRQKPARASGAAKVGVSVERPSKAQVAP